MVLIKVIKTAYTTGGTVTNVAGNHTSYIKTGWCVRSANLN